MDDLIEALFRIASSFAEDGPRSEIVKKAWITRHAHGEGREHRDAGLRDNFGTTNIVKLDADPKLNIERGKAVFTHLAWKQSGFEPKAMYRKGLGWVGVEAGVAGDPNNGFAGGHGIAHILAKHAKNEGITASTVAETIQHGEMYRNYEPKTDAENVRKITIIRGDNVAVVSKFRNGRILITDFNVVKGDDKESAEDKLAKYKKAGRFMIRGENK